MIMGFIIDAHIRKMKNDNIEFLITVSLDSYNSKEEAFAALSISERRRLKREKALDIKAIKWEERKVNPQQLLSLVQSGYCYCPGLFFSGVRNNLNNNGEIWKDNHFEKAFDGNYLNNGFTFKEFWSGSYCIFIDIDCTGYNSMIEYINRLKLKPTIGYYTLSDRPDNRRFKLVYVFDFMINNPTEWEAISKYFHSKIQEDTLELLKDNCGTRLNQMSFPGASYDGYISGIVYEKNDLWNVLYTAKTEEQLQAERQTGKDSSKIEIDQKLVSILSRNFPVKDLRINYVDRIYRTLDEVSWIDTSIFSLTRIGFTTTNYWELINTPRKDHQERRKTLWKRMCLRRIIKPDATPEEILVNAYIDREALIDNSDGVVSVDNLVRNVKSAFCYEIDELKNMFNPTIEYLKANSPSMIFYNARWTNSDGELVKMDSGLRGKAKQMALQSFLKAYFLSPGKTDKEMIEEFNKCAELNGIKMRIKSRTTIFNARKVYGIEKEDRNLTRNKKIFELHEQGLSASMISDKLQLEDNIGISRQAILKILKKPKPIDKPEETEIIDISEVDNLDSLDWDSLATDWLKEE